MASVVRSVSLKGSDSVRVFGGLFEGGYHIQQEPSEAVKVIDVIRSRVHHPRLLEVGSASGGFARLLDDELECASIHVVDDNRHPKAPLRQTILPHAVEWIGDSHDSGPWLDEHGPWDLAVIDADHSYAGVRGDTERVIPRLAPGALVVFHDTLQDRWGVKRWVAELKAGAVPNLAYIASVGKIHGLAVFRVEGETVSNQPPPKVPATLLYHFCGWKQRQEMIDFHVAQLRRYLPLFSKVRINIVSGAEFADADTIKALLLPSIATDDVRFFETPNEGSDGEVLPFFTKLLPEVGDDEMVFYSHTKGAMKTKPVHCAVAWAEMMYVHCLSNVRAIAALMERYPCVGPFQLDAPNHPGRWGQSRWHYGGTFFWFRGIRRYDKWEQYFPNRYGVEGWLGCFVPKGDTCNLIDESVRQAMRYNGGGIEVWKRLPQ